MGLSPEEEDSFAAIVAQLGRRRDRMVPWAIVLVSAAVVGVASEVAVLLGVHHHFAALFYATFVVALVAGLLSIVVVRRRARPL